MKITYVNWARGGHGDKECDPIHRHHLVHSASSACTHGIPHLGYDGLLRNLA